MPSIDFRGGFAAALDVAANQLEDGMNRKSVSETSRLILDVRCRVTCNHNVVVYQEDVSLETAMSQLGEGRDEWERLARGHNGQTCITRNRNLIPGVGFYIEWTPRFAE